MSAKYFDQTSAYSTQEYRLEIAVELLSYAHMLYHRVYVFQNLEAYAKSFENGNPPKEYWEAAFYEKMIDQIKICTAFENYNKAILLLNGFMVHKINRKKNKTLGVHQESGIPVLISDFLQTNSFVLDNSTGELFLDGLSKSFTTITFSETLNENYQNIIALDPNFLSYLKSVNLKRNRLHFYKSYAGAYVFSNEIKKLEFAKEYGTAKILGALERSREILKTHLLT